MDDCYFYKCDEYAAWKFSKEELPACAEHAGFENHVQIQTEYNALMGIIHDDEPCMFRFNKVFPCQNKKRGHKTHYRNFDS